MEPIDGLKTDQNEEEGVKIIPENSVIEQVQRHHKHLQWLDKLVWMPSYFAFVCTLVTFYELICQFFDPEETPDGFYFVRAFFVWFLWYPLGAEVFSMIFDSCLDYSTRNSDADDVYAILIFQFPAMFLLAVQWLVMINGTKPTKHLSSFDWWMFAGAHIIIYSMTLIVWFFGFRWNYFSVFSMIGDANEIHAVMYKELEDQVQ